MGFGLRVRFGVGRRSAWDSGRVGVRLLVSRHVAVLEVVPHVVDELDHRIAPSLLALRRVRLVAKRERTRGEL